MKTKPNDSAKPLTNTIIAENPVNGLRFNKTFSTGGLTKLEEFSAMAMVGMLQNGGMTEYGQLALAPSTLAKLAVNQAKELIKALNEED